MAAPTDRYCEGCGASLQLRRTPEGGPVGRLSADTCVNCGSRELGSDGFCEQCGRAQPAARDRMEYDLGLVAGVSDRGRVRARNEDSMAFAVIGPQEAPRAVVTVVCDGVGSTERADAASQAAVDAALESIVDCLLGGKDPNQATVEGAAAAYSAVEVLARADSPETAPSSTLVSAVATENEITVGWIGDSRAYWVGSASDLLTTDHTDHHVKALTRWVGADAEPGPPNVISLSPGEPGRLIVCSDGLWNYLPTAEDIAAESSGAPPLTVAAELTAVALERGGGDNITVVVVPYPFDLSRSEGP